MNNTRIMHKGYVIINQNRFAVSLAIDNDEQVNGLMHIDPPLTSMAFIYTKPQINKFWMKNVKGDLDILFCYKGKIIEIVRAEAQNTTLLGRDEYSDLVIEFPADITDKYGIAVGDDVKMSIAKGAISKIFAR